MVLLKSQYSFEWELNKKVNVVLSANTHIKSPDLYDCYHHGKTRESYSVDVI
jgi:hypothetical protein